MNDSVDSGALKAHLRSELRAWRASVSAKDARDAARRAAGHVLRERALATARRVAVYLPLKHELGTWPLIDALHASSCEVFAPRVRPGRQLSFVRLTASTPLRRNRWGVLEPAGHAACALHRELDLVLLPLLGFDASGNRLGTGAGYYDRWLGQHHGGRRPLRVGYAYALQQTPHLPEEPWDQRMDAVVTERGVTWFS